MLASLIPQSDPFTSLSLKQQALQLIKSVYIYMSTDTVPVLSPLHSSYIGESEFITLYVDIIYSFYFPLSLSTAKFLLSHSTNVQHILLRNAFWSRMSFNGMSKRSHTPYTFTILYINNHTHTHANLNNHALPT